jgi:hypothetical protein
MQKVGFWTKVAGTVRILGKDLGRGFKVSEFQGFKDVMGVQGVELKIEVEFLQSPALFERFETLKL